MNRIFFLWVILTLVCGAIFVFLHQNGVGYVPFRHFSDENIIDRLPVIFCIGGAFAASIISILKK